MKLKTHTFIQFLASHSLLIKALDYFKKDCDQDYVIMYFSIGAIAFLRYKLRTPDSIIKTWKLIDKDTTKCK